MTLGSHCYLKKKRPVHWLSIVFDNYLYLQGKKKSPNFLHIGTPKYEKVTAQVCIQGRKQVQQNLIQIVTIHPSLHLNAHKMARHP